MSLSIKQASESDAAIMSKICCLGWKCSYRGMLSDFLLNDLPEDYWTKDFKHLLKNRLVEAFLILKDSVPAGCIIYSVAREKKFRGYGELIALYIHPDFYRRRYGEILIKRAMNRLYELNMKQSYLWVLKKNKGARKFYKRMGFSCNGDEMDCPVSSREMVTDIRYVYKKKYTPVDIQELINEVENTQNL